MSKKQQASSTPKGAATQLWQQQEVKNYFEHIGLL